MFERIREDIRSVYDRDPAARNAFEVLTTYPGLHAVWLHRLSHALWQRRWRWLARWLSSLARWLTGIEIHPGAKIGRRFFIDHGMGVVIGETAEIGDDCTIYHGVTLGGTSWKEGKRHPTLENNVVIGAGAKILGPITLGDACRIGSNAVVLKNVTSGDTVVGIPGRSTQQRSEKDKLRSDIAQKLGFDAYGVAQDMPDPVAHAINCMLDHIQQLDMRVEQLSAQVRLLGGDIEAKVLPSLEGIALAEDEIKSNAVPHNPAKSCGE
ncbi:MAG TPA: serine O-acetyltransferase [bacterium]|nr:serine O-acetyltransferase [bacterium]